MLDDVLAGLVLPEWITCAFAEHFILVRHEVRNAEQRLECQPE